MYRHYNITVGCRYDAVQYNMILHASMAEAQHKSELELSPARYVLSIVGIVERMNRVISSDENTKNNSISGTY